MIGKLVLRGLVVGVVAGLIAFVCAKIVAEPSIEAAIGFESAQAGDAHAGDAHAAAAAEAEEPELFSRGVQSGIGLLTGVVVVGAALGGLFGILFAFGNGRLGTLGPQGTSLLLALFGLMSIYLVPALKYPPNPPAVGDPDTIKYRTALYFLMMAISVAATLGALMFRQRLVPKQGAWNASLIAAAAYVVVIAVSYLLLPGINEIPDHFPAATLWEFRVSSFAVQTVMWASIGLMFGYLVDRTRTQ